MLGDFQSAEYRELAEDMFQDGMDGEFRPRPKSVYNPDTLTTTVVPSVPVPTKVIFVTAPQSTTIKFDVEQENEDFKENRIVSCLYDGPSEVMDVLYIEGFGEYTVTAIAVTNPLGVTIYQRFKVSR